MTQLVTRIPAPLAEEIDRLVEAGAFRNRSDVVRAALHLLVDRHHRAEVGAQIVDAYQRIPQGDDELGWADEGTVSMIAEEPW